MSLHRKTKESNSLSHKYKGRIYFPKYEIPKKNEVLHSLGVKEGTFAGGMISRLYDYYFAGAIDFVNEYHKYYSKEFDSVEEFIEERYNIPSDDAELFAKKNYCMKVCSSKSIERNLETLNYDAAFKEMFSEAVGGIDDEDPDGFYYE